jgi:hypothetical protein
LDHASSQKHYPAVEAVVNKLVELYRSETALSFSIFHNLLQREDVYKLSDLAILDILQLIRSSPYEAQSLPPQILNQTLLQRAGNKAIEGVLLDILKLQIRDVTIPEGPLYAQYEPPTSIHHAFMLLPPLVIRQPQVALDIFNTLLEKGFILSSSVEDPELLNSDDVRLIMLCGLAKASIHWDFPALLPEIATRLRQTKSAHTPLVSETLTTLITFLLHQQTASNSRDTLKACLSIVRAYRVPDNVIRRFYQNAHENDCAEEAAELYVFSRGVLAEGHRPYPAPRQMTLGWLMEYLYKSRQGNLCQILAREVLDEQLSIPESCIRHFITCAALTSPKDDFSVAHGLWERYAHPTRVELEDPEQYEGPLPLATVEGRLAALRVKKSILADGGLALAMMEGLKDAMRAKKALSELERDTPENPEFHRLKKEIRLMNVFMRRISANFETHRANFKGSRIDWYSYSVRIQFAARYYRQAVRDMRTLLRFPMTKVQEQLPLCFKSMASFDAGMAAILVQDLVKRGIDIAPSICLDILERAKEQDEVEAAEQLKATMARKGSGLKDTSAA